VEWFVGFGVHGELGELAQDVKVTITDSTPDHSHDGLGPQSGGPFRLMEWRREFRADGSFRTYNFTVAATGANGQAIGVSNSITGIVTQVSYANGTSTLVLNNAHGTRFAAR